MQFLDFYYGVYRWFAENISGICVSILASVILIMLPKVYNFFKRVSEHVSWKDQKGMQYIIVRHFKDETVKDIFGSLIRYFTKSFGVFGPFLIVLIVLYIESLFVKFGATGILGIVFFVFITVLYTLYRQKNRKPNVKANNITDALLLVLALLCSFSAIVMALLSSGNENSMHYIAVISCLLFLLLVFGIESRNSEECYISVIKKIKCVRYLGMVIGYAIFFKELNDNWFVLLFYTWFFICTFEHIYSELIGKNSLVLYTIKCKAGDYKTHDNIFQMKDGKVNFKKDDLDIYMINKEEIKCIVYKIENSTRYGKKRQSRIKYVMMDGKEEICDTYNYLEEDWIEFIKWDAGNRESTIIPSNRIKCIMSCK